MADYYVDLNGNLTKKNKKKKKADYTVSLDGKITKTEDIAPVTTTTKSKERTWFESGAFSDGYQFGDVTKTILGSGTDLLENVGTGIIGMGEKAVDTMLYLAPAFSMGQKVQNGAMLTQADLDLQREMQKTSQEFIKKDLYDEEKVAKAIISNPVKAVTGIDAETDSVFGEKSDALAQSGGQLLATMGLNAVGLPWWLTTGTTSFGGEVETASKEGATYSEAGASGLITAGAEILTEKLSGGIKFGGKTLDDVWLKPLTEQITDKTARTLTKLGFNAVGEGGEEVLTEIISNLGTSLYKEENISELLTSEEALDGYIESFIGGAVLGGGISGIDAIKTNKSGKDYVTGLTENETKVVDKEIENRVKEREADGTKLTRKEKYEIREQVMNDLDKGYINLDTIESELGGETYEAYKSSIDKEKSLKDEIAKLEGNPSANAQNKLSELKAELSELTKNDANAKLKDQLSLEVQELTKSERLSESYNEKARRTQKFEADLTKYDAKTQGVIKKATESGILNNTNRTHEFVDMVAKLSADKGVSFDFTNNENLKKSGFAIEGKTINGLVKDNDIILNIDSSKALNTVVGHEITHVLEGTELYTELQNVVKEYATTKGEYETRYKAIQDLYKDVEGANIDNELTADLVGEYLFTDSDFINNLSTTKPTVFEKIYNEIKYLYKVATAGSKEARELEKVKRAFDKAYKESGKAESDTKYSFGGINSRNADESQLSIAKQMEQNGATTEEIRKTTGWHRGYDNKWRYEIDDSESYLLEDPILQSHFDEGGSYHTGKLEDILKHEELYKAYPKLKDLDIVIQQTEAGVRGISFSDSIVLSLDLFQRYTENYKNYLNGERRAEIERIEQTPEYKEYNRFYEDEELQNLDPEEWLAQEKEARDKFFSSELGKRYHDLKWGTYKGVKYEIGWSDNAKEVLMHEIQHNIQRLEGFAMGSSEEYWQERIENGYDSRRRAVKDEEQELANEYYAMREENLEFVEEMEELLRSSPDMPRGQIDWETLEEIEEDPIEWQEFDAKRDALEEKYGTDKVFNYITFNHKRNSVKNQGIRSAGDLYYATAGEIEARDTARRVDYSKEQRKQTEPRGKRENLIKDDVVFAKYSLSDSNGRTLTKEQHDYFKDSAVRDENGNLKVMYHGTSAGGHTVFDPYGKAKYGLFGTGTYFTDDPSVAESYTEKGRGNNKQVYETYLNIKKPIDMDSQGDYEAWKKALPDAHFPKEGTNEDYYRAMEEYFEDNEYSKAEASETAMEVIESMGYDGITHVGGGRFNKADETRHRVYIAFSSEQIKNVDNTKPTTDADIRHSLSEEYSLGDQVAPIGNYNVYGKDIALETAPVEETVQEVADEYAPITDASMIDAQQNDRLYSLNESEMPDEVDAPTRQQHEAIEPAPTLDAQEQEWANNKMTRVKDPNKVTSHKVDVKQRRWVETSTESEVVNREILPDDLDLSKIVYEPIPNKVTLGNANSKLSTLGYDEALTYFNSQLAGKKATLDDIALGERLLQEAMKKGDKVTAGELIQNISILGTELGQKVQALSIIQRLTPEGQLKMLYKTVKRGKVKGDKAFEGVELTQEMIDHILKTYKADGTFDQNELNKAVEDVKKDIAKNMKVTTIDKVNAWRYLAMLGNPKTHIRNLVSNVAMKGTVGVKNVIARTIESVAPIKERTKTFKLASKEVKAFAEATTLEMKDVISEDTKYSEEASIKSKRDMFKNKILNKVYEFNNDLMEKEDWWFSKSAYKNSLSEYLTANGIKTTKDIENNPQIVEKAKQYALEQSQIATFRQYSWLANKIREVESKNTATEIAVGSILPFKKTPINIAKAGLSYSPLGFTKALTYDLYQMKNGKMQASQVVDNLAQGVTGSALVYVGYMLAMSGLLNGGGDDDKEGTYDYQLGKQAYSLSFGGNTYSLSWLSPVAMPLFVGANAYEQLVEGEEWNGDVVMETLAQTLDPLSEMSFLSSLDSVLSSYDSGVEKFAGIGETMLQSYLGQFIPTLSSQVATVMDDKKRSTKVAGDSDFKIVDETINKLIYKIPVLRETLEPTTDIWGNEVKQSENMIERALETFIAPYSRKESIATEIDAEIKELYAQTGDNGIIPNIPYNYVNYDGEKYNMSAKEHTEFKKTYGQTANDLLEDLFNTTTYQNATSEDRAELVNKVYDYARDEAKREYLEKEGVEYTNATQDGMEYYKENSIKGAIENDMTLDEFDMFAKTPEKYYVAKAVGGYDAYKSVSSVFSTLEADKDENGNSINGSRKTKIIEYINTTNLDYGAKLIMFKSVYNADDTYNNEIIEYLNSRTDITYEEEVAILKELGFTVDPDGTIRW